MPWVSGFDILNDLRERRRVNPHVVFTTAHDEYAIKAFDYAAFDYLLKPIDPERLLETFHRYRKNGSRDSIDRASSLFDNDKVLIFRGHQHAQEDGGRFVFETAQHFIDHLLSRLINEIV